MNIDLQLEPSCDESLYWVFDLVARKATERKNILDDNKHLITDRDRESLEEPLALITGRWLFGCGAWEEPHESSSHPALVDNLRVTWEIQH